MHTHTVDISQVFLIPPSINVVRIEYCPKNVGNNYGQKLLTRGVRCLFNDDDLILNVCYVCCSPSGAGCLRSDSLSSCTGACPVVTSTRH